ncbi:MAG: OadG family protein, partial [Oscillospiraceae bacterium]|nr:OadG family protein [Oscillospiraceae bacterium]
MDWDLAGKVTLVGMILVFLALIVLWLIIQLIGFVMKGFNKKNKDKIS